MNWAEYVAATDETAVYPGAGTGSAREFAYVALGLQGELGELFSLLAQSLTRPDDERLISEIGDCLYYTARGYRALEAAYRPVSDEPSEETDFSTRHAMVRALLLGNTTKKLLREDADPGTPGHDRLLAQLASDYRYFVEFLRVVCLNLDLLEISPESVMAMNLKKLRQRKAAGTLKGSGDGR